MSSQGLQQVQKQTQSLVLAPQLRQSLKILQVPAIELRNAILEELQANPALEELTSDSISLEGSRESANGQDEPTDSESRDELDFTEDFSILNRLDEDWRDYMAQAAGSLPYTSDDAERRQHFFDSISREDSLTEHLIQQARMSDAPEPVLQALEYVVGNLDDGGFLRSTASEMALMSNMPLADVQRAVDLLQTLDPPGIGAKDVREALLIQLRQLGKDRSLAATILREHYDLLLRRRIPELARKLGVTTEDVQSSIEVIAGLNPSPGRVYSDDANQIIEPDVRVERDEHGGWVIHLNSDYIPRLRISNTYKELLAKGKLKGKEREYIQEKFRSGKFLISAIEQRQQTIERITREILRFQADFFDRGVSELRPLTMNQVAEKVGVHETTVSRAIANKYIETPHGVFDFKYFFTPGYEGNNGKAVSNTSIKERIGKIIESEPPSKPYSDQKIVEILKEENITIARRTVAKYREELGILPTNLRRRYN